MTWFDRFITGAIAAGFMLIAWFIQRCVSKAKESETVDRATKKVAMIDKLEQHGLPKDAIINSLMGDLGALNNAGKTRLETTDTSRILEAMRVAAKNDDTRIISEEEIAALEEERAELYEQSVCMQRALGAVTGALVNDDTFATILTNHCNVAAAELVVKMRKHGIELGRDSRVADAFPLDEMVETMERLPVDAVDKTLRKHRDALITRIEAIKLAREQLEAGG